MDPPTTGTPLLIATAFSDGPGTGNQAGVCVLDRPGDERWMQQLAADLDFAETAFVVPTTGPPFPLRWFSPKVEIDLCGHATLATAHALWELGRVPPGQPISFATRGGELATTPDGELIWLDLPLTTSVPEPDTGPLADALAIEPVSVWRADGCLMAELSDETAVRELTPDLRAVAGLDTKVVYATAPPDGGDDFVLRVFGPKVGIPEDPATGSAQCMVAPYWAHRTGRSTLTSRQLSARGARIAARVGDRRVLVGGRVTTIVHGRVDAVPAEGRGTASA